MKPHILFILFLFCLSCQSSKHKGVAVDQIKIARDQWGVPHIYAPTDAEVAYGLAWAECEDDFVTLQEQMLGIRGRLGEYKGRDGIVVDFGIQFMGLREVVNQHYESAVTGPFKKYVEHFVAGINAYAALHPEELLIPDVFPLSEKDILMGYLMGNVEISGAGKDLVKILENKIAPIPNADLPKGSNAIAISKRKTNTEETFLAINSHQPLEGWYSWYEAHLISEEGLNILGGTFPGGICIFHGVNQHLGWAHTVNHADFSDVYQLTMHPTEKLKYRFDGEWKTLTEKKYWAWLKMFGPIKIPIRRTIYESIYGPTFETEQGFFSWRYVVAQNLGAAEQWLAMNKATNFEEFKTALERRKIVSNNIVYADQDDNIYYLSNGKLPIRNPNYNWKSVLPGDTSATLWSNNYYPLDSLPQVENPNSGFVYNTNNTPFSSSAKADNPIEDEDNLTMGYQTTGVENNRSARLLELLTKSDTLDYATFKSIKYDLQYPTPLRSPNMTNLEMLLQLQPDKYPEIKEALRLLNDWDRSTHEDNTTASLFIVSLNTLIEQLKKEERYKPGQTITASDCAKAIHTAQQELQTQFGTLQVPLGALQKHQRDTVSLPLGGGPDVLAAMYSRKQEDGTYKGVAGESYIMLARFGPEGVQLETVNAYGTNAEKNHPHHTDQMELFVKRQLKPMTLDWEQVVQTADTIYSPMQVVNF